MCQIGRRQFLVAGGALLVVPIAAGAQRADRVYRTGFVSPTPPGPRNVAFVQGLRELGYVEGHNASIEMRFAEGWPERLPDLVHVAALWISSNAAAAGFVKALQVAAQMLKVRLDAHQAANSSELDAAFAAIGSSGARGLIVTPSPLSATNRDKLVRFAASMGVPAVYFVEDFVSAGGLMSYGPSIADSYRRAASYVDKILKGAKPGDLTIEQPTRFGLAVNLRTARARAADAAIGPASRRRGNRVTA